MAVEVQLDLTNATLQPTQTLCNTNLESLHLERAMAVEVQLELINATRQPTRTLCKTIRNPCVWSERGRLKYNSNSLTQRFSRHEHYAKPIGILAFGASEGG